jgi:hypothetical protein
MLRSHLKNNSEFANPHTTCRLFLPELLADVFNNPLVLEALFDCAIEGYSRLSFSSDVDALCHQVRTFCVVSTNYLWPMITVLLFVHASAVG